MHLLRYKVTKSLLNKQENGRKIIILRRKIIKLRRKFIKSRRVSNKNPNQTQELSLPTARIIPTK